MREALAAYPFPHIYPDPEQRALRAALAEYVGVPAANIFPGHGADELIDLLCRVFLGPGDAIINCPPTFGMYEFDAGLAGARVIEVPRRADFSVDVERISESANQRTGESRNTEYAIRNHAPRITHHAPKLLFLTSPNNPDGSLLAPDDLRRLLDLPLIVVLDEAYIEFAGLERRWRAG